MKIPVLCACTVVTTLFFPDIASASHAAYKYSSDNKDGPGKYELLVKSNNNMNFKRGGEVIIKGGHVPALLEFEGQVLLYFQWFPRDVSKIRWFDHVGVAIRDKSSINWAKPVGITIQGIPKRVTGKRGRPMDPVAVNLPNGKIRLFFTMEKFQPWNKVKGDARIHSALSTDGINFDYEAYPRFSIDDLDIRDPAVIYFKDNWHLYAPNHKNSGTGYHATSMDGLEFIRQPDVKIRAKGDWLGNVTISNNKMYFFGSVWAAHSVNGNDWHSLKSRGLGPDPAVIKLKNGSWLAVTFRAMK